MGHFLYHKYIIMVDTSISAFPWLCSTMPNKNDWDCGSVNGNIVSEQEGNNAEAFTTEAYGKYGLQSVYYKVSEDLERDKIFGEDPLQVIERAFNFMMYTEQIPPNVRTYQIQGIWGEDVITCYVGRTAFKYWSTYGGADRNTPQVYDDFQPRIGDLVYLPNNDTIYEIRDVKYYQEAFGLQSHTYTLTLKVYKGHKLTIDTENETLPSTDVIYKYATSGFTEQYEMNDMLKNNDILKYEALKKSENVNHMDVLYNPNKDYETLETYSKTISDKFKDYNKQFRDISLGTDTVMGETEEMEEEMIKFKQELEQKTKEYRNELKDIGDDLDNLEMDLEKVTYTDGENGLPKPHQ